MCTPFFIRTGIQPRTVQCDAKRNACTSHWAAPHFRTHRHPFLYSDGASFPVVVAAQHHVYVIGCYRDHLSSRKKGAGQCHWSNRAFHIGRLSGGVLVASHRNLRGLVVVLQISQRPRVNGPWGAHRHIVCDQRQFVGYGSLARYSVGPPHNLECSPLAPCVLLLLSSPSCTITRSSKVGAWKLKPSSQENLGCSFNRSRVILNVVTTF